MADSKEKNLLNEIGYLTRLIGQHKHRLTCNETWDPSHSYKFSTGYSGAHTHSRLPKSVKTTNVSSHGCISKQKPSSNLKTYYRKNIHTNSTVHFNSQFQGISSCSAVTSNRNLLNPKLPHIHINPNFQTSVETTRNNVQDNPISKTGNITVIDPKTVKSSAITCKNVITHEQKLKVHVNPKFYNALPANSPHTQLRTLMSNKVHVNPKLVERMLQENNVRGVGESIATEKIVRVQQPSAVTKSKNFVHISDLHKQNIITTKLICHSASKGNEFISLGNKKLVRVNRKEDIESKKEKLRIHRNSVSSPKLKCMPIASPRTIKRAKSISSKYKLVKIHSPLSSSKTNVKTKYKIDRTASVNFCQRTLKKDNLAFRLKRVKPQGQGRIPATSSRTINGNLVWQRTWSLLAEEFKTTNAKLCRIGSSPVVKKDAVNTAKVNRVSSTSLVRIGGVLYRSSRNKLTRSTCPVNAAKKKSNNTVPIKKKGKTDMKQQILFIRGQKFVMDAQGKTLKRISSAESSFGKNPAVTPSYSVRRVDIGGVTFVQKSSNVLVRTDTHKARSLLSYAKQKSIETLMKKLKKNNQPCIFYRRFGRCLRNEKGKCPCVHDRKHVDVCKRFLQSKCQIDGCLLSHDVVPEKMPTCKFFLEGCCTKTDCPYLHVKVNAKADICTSFLQGYCSNAGKCKKRHINICPEFEKEGKCLKGKNCPYPHIRAKKSQPKRRFSIKVSKPPLSSNKPVINVKKRLNPQEKVEMKRYYLTPREAVETSSSLSDSSVKQPLEESKSNLNISCSSQVSKKCEQETSVEEKTVGIVMSENKKEREKIGLLPSFIPL